MPVNTRKVSEKYRLATLDSSQQKILMTLFPGSDQEADLSEPSNCQGFGRIRHFRRATSTGWPDNSLPIDPAARALGYKYRPDELRAQVFQNAACNWRCWYCFVPFNLLSADARHSSWLTVSELVDQYSFLTDGPPIIDLSGGQPDLTPELVLWTMQSLKRRGMAETTYLWSDDNLSTDYFWRHLSDAEQAEIATYPNYGKVGCFKGYDETSFSFNTAAEPELYEQQFILMKRLIASGIDTYAYTTFTSPDNHELKGKMSTFIDKLQEINPLLPLRTIPLEVQIFSSSAKRIRPEHILALNNQKYAIDAWSGEIENRFTSAERKVSIVDHRLIQREVHLT